jgi:hypothetical protein
LTVDEGVVRETRIVREEEIGVGDERRSCYVIESQIQPTHPSRDASKSANPATLGVTWLVTMLRLQGLAEQGLASYSPWPDENGSGVGQPTSLTLWIDKHPSVVVRTKMSAQLYKRTDDAAGQGVEKVAVTAVDSFTVAAVGPPPDDLFRFTPPEGAREVPNVASRRSSKRRRASQ